MEEQLFSNQTLATLCVLYDFSLALDALPDSCFTQDADGIGDVIADKLWTAYEFVTDPRNSSAGETVLDAINPIIDEITQAGSTTDPSAHRLFNRKWVEVSDSSGNYCGAWAHGFNSVDWLSVEPFHCGIALSALVPNGSAPPLLTLYGPMGEPLSGISAPHFGSAAERRIFADASELDGLAELLPVPASVCEWFESNQGALFNAAHEQALRRITELADFCELYPAAPLFSPALVASARLTKELELGIERPRDQSQMAAGPTCVIAAVGKAPEVAHLRDTSPEAIQEAIGADIFTGAVEWPIPGAGIVASVYCDDEAHLSGKPWNRAIVNDIRDESGALLFPSQLENAIIQSYRGDLIVVGHDPSTGEIVDLPKAGIELALKEFRDPGSGAVAVFLLASGQKKYPSSNAKTAAAESADSYAAQCAAEEKSKGYSRPTFLHT